MNRGGLVAISGAGLVMMAGLAVVGVGCDVPAISGPPVLAARAADEAGADLKLELESERRSVRVGDSVGISLRIVGPGLRKMLRNADGLPLDGFQDDAFVYHFRVRPAREGVFAVGPYSLLFNGQSLQSNGASLTVLPEWEGRCGTFFRVDRSTISLGESFELVAETWSKDAALPPLSLKSDGRFNTDRSFTMNAQQVEERRWTTYACWSWEITPTEAGDFLIDGSLFRDLPETVEPPKLVVHVQGPFDAAVDRGDSHPLLPNEFRWNYGPRVVEAKAVGGWDWISMKDPSIVRYGDKWHLFCTVRGSTRSHAIVYLSFRDFDEANRVPRFVLPCHSGHFCAPQVFYFTPQKKWYLICQAADEAWGEPYGEIPWRLGLLESAN